ncbi:transcriptional regulator [Serratia fonticola]|uniref:Transcriptional regulator n=1 Tax=Serratia fonticola TaxID=47917 RepID=A0A542BGS8_SERFO|nr:transcriptional regulator [Serratia fonticola]TQI95216.1 transcriptional regulator [Serratia fonticola]TVZ69713.1 transcriptional regulator [Serratia fonticola]
MINGSYVQEGKKLTDTANRILSLLIAAPGEVFERNYLLESVWESAGHTSSSASLSQYISILRKILTSLIDIEETIISVPKVGFFFSPDISVTVYESPEATPASAPVPVIVNHEDVAVKEKSYRKVYIGCGLIIFALLIANILVYMQPKSTPRYNQLYDIGEMGECKLSSYEQVPSDIHQRLLDAVLLIQPDMKQKCSEHPAQVIIQAQRSVLYGSRGRMFYSFCPTDKESGKIIYCENHNAYNWEMK